MKNKSILVIIVLAIAGTVGYWGFSELGGNNPIEIQLIAKKPDNLAGITYRGIPGNNELGEIFQKMETQKGLHPGTKLHTIYEVEPAGKLDTMIVFVGINQNFPSADLEFKTFENSSYLLAKIQSNKWVMASPETVKKKLADFAIANQVELDGIFIDKIISENEVQVIAPIR